MISSRGLVATRSDVSGAVVVYKVALSPRSDTGTDLRTGLKPFLLDAAHSWTTEPPLSLVFPSLPACIEQAEEVLIRIGIAGHLLLV